MKFGITGKITLLTISIALITAMTVATILYKNSYLLLQQYQLESNVAVTARNNQEIIYNTKMLQQDVLFLSHTPPIQGIIRTQSSVDFDGSTNSLWKQRLNTLFKSLLLEKDHYMQIRYIGVKNNGKEIVRVDRIGGEGIIADTENLQEKGKTKYFKEAIKLKRGEIYISEINLNREHGKIVEPHIPVIRVATPIYSYEGKLFGVLVINMEISRLLDIYKEDVPEYSKLYITNNGGEFLLHTTPEKNFGFEFGKSYKIQEEYPILEEEFIKQHKIDFGLPNETFYINNEVLQFFEIYFDKDHHSSIRVVLISPENAISSYSVELRNQSIYITIALIILSLLVGWFFAGRLTKPLKKIMSSVKKFNNGNQDVSFSVKSSDEIGVLSNTLDKMVQKINQSNNELNASMDKLELQNLAMELAANEAKEAHEEADKANRAKSIFLANMSHEIRTPMNGILGTVTILASSTLSKEQEYQVNLIEKSGDALLEIINEILDFSKIEAGQMILEPTVNNLTQSIDDVVGILTLKAQENNLTISSKFSKDIPKFVICDIGRIRQVIMNLVGNAVKFTEKGGIKVSIDVTELTDSNVRLLFKVSDTGIGIPADKIDGIFAKFSQADNSSIRKTTGTGLGLAICKSLVELMDGTIDVETIAGEGSTFFFDILFPIAMEDEIAKYSEQHISREILHFDAKVLLVDDVLANQYVAQSFLESLGCRVNVASNGREAIELMQQQEYNIVFMDCQMPEVDGYEATNRIRAMEVGNKHTTIIALTANAMADDRDKCTEAGMDDYITKPVKIEDLSRIMDLWQIPQKTDEEVVIVAEHKIEGNNDVLDYQVLNQMRDMMGDKIKKIIDISINDIKEFVGELESAIKDKKYEEITRHSHSLKSITAQVGAMNFSKLSKEIEELSKNQQIDKISEIFKDLSEESLKVLEELNNYV